MVNKKEKTKPSDFLSFPFDSVMQNSESETVGRNIMVILSRTSDEFRELSWKEYKEERLKDKKSNFSENEKGYFFNVIGYFDSYKTARLFSKDWR